MGGVAGTAALSWQLTRNTEERKGIMCLCNNFHDLNSFAWSKRLACSQLYQRGLSEPEVDRNWALAICLTRSATLLSQRRIDFIWKCSVKKKKKTERKWHNRFQCNIYCVGELVQTAVVQHLDSRKFELIFTVVCFYSWEIECKSCMAGTKVSLLHLAQSLTFTLTSAYSHVRQITFREKKKRKGKIKYLPYFLSSVKFVLAGHTVVFHYIQPIDSLLLSFL